LSTVVATPPAPTGITVDIPSGNTVRGGQPYISDVYGQLSLCVSSDAAWPGNDFTTNGWQPVYDKYGLPNGGGVFGNASKAVTITLSGITSIPALNGT